MASALTEQLSDSAPAPVRTPLEAALQRRRRAQRARITYRVADAAMLLAASATAVDRRAGAAHAGNFAWGAAYALLTL